MGKTFMQQSYSETSIKDATLTPDRAPDGEVFYNNMGRQVGQVSERESVSKTLDSGETVTLEKGLYESDSVLKAKTIQEVAYDGNLTPEYAEEGKVFYNSGGRQVGEVPVQTSMNKTLSNGESLELPAGIYRSSSFIQAVSLASVTANASAVDSEILAGKSAYVNGELVVGTMKDRRGYTSTWCGYENCEMVVHPTDSSQALITIPNVYSSVGYYDSSSKITVNVWNAVPKNIRAGIRVGRYKNSGADDSNSILGTFTGDATAVASYILRGKTAGINGNMVTGTMPALSWDSTIGYAAGNSTKVIEADALFVNTNTDGVERLCLRYTGESGFITGNTLFGLDVASVRNGLGITSDKIVSGKSILGVSGSAISGPSLTELARSTSSSSDSDSVSSSRFGTYAVLKVYSGHSITADAFIGNVIMKVSDVLNGKSYHLYDNNDSVYCAGLNNDNGNVRATKTRNYSYVLYTTNDISAYT